MPDAEQWTILGLVGGIAGAGLAKLWVFGWTYTQARQDLAEMTVDRNFWRDAALKALRHGDAALGEKE
jgi:hypothetical protein